MPLTRRELRERERAARAPVAAADARHTTHHDSGVIAPVAEAPVTVEAAPIALPPVAPAEAESLEPASVFMPLAQALAAAELHLPELDLPELHLAELDLPESDLPELDLPEPEIQTIPDTDRLVAAPAASEAPVSDLEQLQTDVSPVTTSTPIQFPTRAQARARQAASLSEQPAASLPESPLRSASLPDLPRPRAIATAAPAAAPKFAQNAKPANGLGRRLATTGFSFVAMAFVALMAVSTSLPAEALLSSADVQAAARASLQTPNSEPAQTLTMSGGTDVISVQRDGYESKTIAEVAAASGIRLEATFTNNPNGTIQWPFAVGVHIGDRFGYRNCAGCSSNHGGQDFNPGDGAPIQAIADGVVSYAEDGEGSYGVYMIIDHVIDGKVVSSLYAHMTHGSMLFKTGDVVKVGQVIGKVGNTGMSTGPHLHLDIRLGGKDGTKVDPLVWLRANTN